MSKAKLERVEQITVLTVYDKKESILFPISHQVTLGFFFIIYSQNSNLFHPKSYLMRDWEKYGDQAPVIKHIKYDTPPVIKMKTVDGFNHDSEKEQQS